MRKDLKACISSGADMAAKDGLKPKVEEALLAEVQRLRAGNAYLKVAVEGHRSCETEAFTTTTSL